MRRVLEHCAALDVHKKQLTACARVLGPGGELEELTVEFSTMAGDLLGLRDWLKQLGVTHVAMEPTGVYWKPLEDAGIKLSSVASDVLGVSGRLMLEALVSGTRDPEALAELARGTLRKKLPALKQALAGQFKPHHTLIVAQILAHLDYLDEA